MPHGEDYKLKIAGIHINYISLECPLKFIEPSRFRRLHQTG